MYKNNNNDIAALKNQLNQRTLELAKSLFSNRPIARLRGSVRVGRNGSLSIGRNGLFCDHETGQGGDLISLVMYALCCDFITALNWCNSFLGNMPATQKPLDQKQCDDSEIKRIKKALYLWQQTQSAQNTLAELYLRNRGINIPIPPLIRFSKQFYNYTTDKYHPALVAAIQNIHGKVTAIQAIFLTEEGKKIAGDNVKAKLMFGVAKGGAIRLSKLTESLIVCEGLEDSATILQAFPEASVWACGGTSGLINIEVPDTVTDLVIGCDNDEAGIKAARNLAERMIVLGKTVRIARPKAAYKDFNEMINESDITI